MAVPYRRISVKRRALGLSVAIGLIAQAVLSAYTLPAHGLSTTAGSDAGLRSVVICTGDGLARILLDAEGNPVEKSRPDGQGATCSQCCALSCCGKIAPAPAAWLLGRAAGARAALLASADRADTRAPLVRRGHDPPRQA